MKISLPPRDVWLGWVKHIACAVTVTVAFGAGSVIAASESQQALPGNAIAVLCGAVGRCRGAMNPVAPAPEGAVVQSLAPPVP